MTLTEEIKFRTTEEQKARIAAMGVELKRAKLSDTIRYLLDKAMDAIRAERAAQTQEEQP